MSQPIIDESERQEFASKFEEDFAALRDQPAAWKDEQEERAGWESTVNDALDQ